MNARWLLKYVSHSIEAPSTESIRNERQPGMSEYETYFSEILPNHQFNIFVNVSVSVVEKHF